MVKAHAEVGEGPVVDRRTGELVWVDIPRGELHRSDLDTGETVTWRLPTTLGAAVPCTQRDGFAVAVREGFGFAAASGLELTDPVLANLELRMNDAKCDAKGRLWAGSTGLHSDTGRGSLHVWDGDGPSTVQLTGLALPNGIGWNAESDRMYLADSIAREVYVADFDLAQGRPGPFRLFATMDDALPDGLAVDTEGGVWIAMWDGYRVCRFDPSGRLTQTIPMPVARPTSCAFIADGLLAITSARSTEPGSGSVYAVEVEYQGVAVSDFGNVDRKQHE